MSETVSSGLDCVMAGAAELLPMVTAELERTKRGRSELRAELQAAEAEVERLRALERSLSATIHGLEQPEGSSGLVGWRVGEAAAAVLREAGVPLHYRDIWGRMHDAGATIDSEEPESVVLTQLTRHPDILRAGRGIYTLVEPVDAAERERIEAFDRDFVPHCDTEGS